ncbi:hypothetical protein [Neolewinella agarilytica]|uniref:hypothetical protein n=1 Tax=Neolewinella agarilytica TaxID=478744 RepID=UPI0023569CBB|nr:hypothetical protein [Neolewinella agarilytica]
MNLLESISERYRKPCLSAFLLWGLGAWWMLVADLPVNKPTHLRSGFKLETVSKSEGAFLFLNPDTSITHQMNLLYSSEGEPLLYYAAINTPVCIDGICKPVLVEMYWDLLGDYVGYGEYPNQPLTKYDHDPFLSEDHEKLHGLLLDRNSILDRKSLDDLYDLRGVSQDKIAYNGVEIDGISGATKKEITASIVSGALYSCYRLWYLAHGDASRKIRENLPAIYSDTLARQFLRSGQSTYRYYAVRQMEGADFADFAPVMNVFEEGKPLVRKHILKKLPDSLLQRSDIYRPLYEMFPDLDNGSKTLLLKKLPLAPAAAPPLSDHLIEMSRNQLLIYLKQLAKSGGQLPPEVRDNLEEAAQNPDFIYAYLIQDFLTP